MAKSITEQLVELLRELKTTIPQMEGCDLISIEGFMMACCLPVGWDDDTIFGVQAEVLSHAKNLASLYPIGSFEYFCAQGKQGLYLQIPLSEKCFLSVIARRNLGDVDAAVKYIQSFAPRFASLI